MLEVVRVSAGFQHGKVACQIRLLIRKWVVNAVTYASLGGQVNNATDAIVMNDSRYGFDIRYVHAMKYEFTSSVKRRKPCFFQRGIVIIIYIVDPNYGFATFNKTVSRCMADEARSASY
ncbi:hypothetical protein Sbs19_39930 [Sphingobium sp. BS19]|nr:hypothetical protein Sbs19_39930 [Sphingobium sp. BS19]